MISILRFICLYRLETAKISKKNYSSKKKASPYLRLACLFIYRLIFAILVTKGG